MASALSQIKHVVVAMLENRSFDNLAGYFCAADKNIPPAVLPPGRKRVYDGLLPLPPKTTLNPFWNPDNADFFTGGTSWNPVSPPKGPTISSFPTPTRKNISPT